MDPLYTPATPPPSPTRQSSRSKLAHLRRLPGSADQKYTPLHLLFDSAYVLKRCAKHDDGCPPVDLLPIAVSQTYGCSCVVPFKTRLGYAFFVRWTRMARLDGPGCQSPYVHGVADWDLCTRSIDQVSGMRYAYVCNDPERPCPDRSNQGAYMSHAQRVCAIREAVSPLVPESNTAIELVVQYIEIVPTLCVVCDQAKDVKEEETASIVKRYTTCSS